MDESDRRSNPPYTGQRCTSTRRGLEMGGAGCASAVNRGAHEAGPSLQIQDVPCVASVTTAIKSSKTANRVSWLARAASGSRCTSRCRARHPTTEPAPSDDPCARVSGGQLRLTEQLTRSGRALAACTAYPLRRLPLSASWQAKAASRSTCKSRCPSRCPSRDPATEPAPSEDPCAPRNISWSAPNAIEDFTPPMVRM